MENVDRPTLRELVSAQQSRLEHLLDEVIDAHHAGAPADVKRAWRELEARLEEGFELEAVHLTPLLALVDEEQAELLRDEHSGLRAQALVVGALLGRSLRWIAAARALRAMLVRHRARSDALLGGCGEAAWAERSSWGLRAQLQRSLSEPPPARMRSPLADNAGF